MPENVLPTVFTLSYVTAVEDIKEMISIELRNSRRVAWRNTLSTLVLTVLVLVLLMALLGQDDGYGPASIDELMGAGVLGSSCAMVWVRASALTRLSPSRLARRHQTQHSGRRTAYEVELSGEGLASRTDELTIRFSWSYFAEFEETRRQFILKRSGETAGFALPKRGLADAGQIDALRDFLHAHVGRPR